MKVLKRIETITTEDLLTSLVNLLTLSGVLGFMGGMTLAFLLKGAKGNDSLFDAIGGLSAVVLLIFLFWANRYSRKIVVPELLKRYQCGAVSTGNGSAHDAGEI